MTQDGSLHFLIYFIVKGDVSVKGLETDFELRVLDFFSFKVAEGAVVRLVHRVRLNIEKHLCIRDQ